MEQDRILEYLLKNEAARHEADREKHRTWRKVLIAVIASLTIIICFYMYFVIPVEEYSADANNGSQAIAGSSFVESTVNGGK